MLNSSFEQMVQNFQLDATHLFHGLRFHIQASGDVAEVAKWETSLLDFGVIGDYLSVQLLIRRVKLVWDEVERRQ